MPLFRENPARSALSAIVVLFAVHVVAALLPRSLDSLRLFQICVGVLAVASLMVMIVLHHKRDGRNLSGMQEETILICAFGLCWLACLIALRAYTRRPLHPGSAAEAAGANVLTKGRARHHREPGFVAGYRPYPCAADDVYCVVEEWTFF